MFDKPTAAVPLSTRAHLRFRAAALSLKRNAKRRENEKMDFLELAKERYSVRKFSDKKVEREKLDAILEAGRCAPTAVNYQPQRVLVLESPEALEKLKG